MCACACEHERSRVCQGEHMRVSVWVCVRERVGVPA